jgi:hypothetical protein
MLHRVISIAVLVLVVAIGGYIVWSAYSGTGGTMRTELTDQVQKQLAEVRKIQKVNPNLSLLNDKLFQALQPSGGETLVTGAGSSTTSAILRGRTNPFSPF